MCVCPPRYFMLVVALHAQSHSQSYTVAAHSSERIIVRVKPFNLDMSVYLLHQSHPLECDTFLTTTVFEIIQENHRQHYSIL